MGRIVAVTNLKGGIGKTTTVVNLSAGLALKGARVLLIDVDAQGNLAMALGARPRRTLYEVLVDGARAADCITALRPNLDLLAADETLLMAQPTIARRPDWPRVLEQAIRPLRSVYDFIFIDCGGSLTVLNLNALNAASDVVVPTTVEPFSLRGLEMLVNQINRVKGGAGSLKAIVPTMFDPRLRQSIDLLAQLQERYGSLVTAPIRVNVRLSESSAQGRTIYEYDPRSRGALDYAQLVEHLSGVLGYSGPPHTNGAAPHGVPASHQPGEAPTALRPVAPVARPATAQTPLQPAPPAAPRPASETQGPAEARTEPPHAPPPAEPVVIGAGSVLSSICPNCGGSLQRATVAGYRVAYCEHCKYRRQELAAGGRR
jgi:chromosome partitioning protein